LVRTVPFDSQGSPASPDSLEPSASASALAAPSPLFAFVPERVPERAATKCRTYDEVMEGRVQTLTAIIPTTDDGGQVHGGSEATQSRLEHWLVLAFRAVGLLSWEVPCCIGYKRTVCLLACMALASSLSETASKHIDGFQNPICKGLMYSSNVGLVSDVVMAAGGLVTLVLLQRSGNQNCIDSVVRVLQAYAQQHDLTERWVRAAATDAAFMLSLFLAANAISFAGTMTSESNPVGMCMSLHHMTFFTVSFMHMMLITFLLYVIRVLTVTVDMFCYRLVIDPSMDEAMQDWNVLQALLRRAAGSVELALIILLAMMAWLVAAFSLDYVGLGSSLSTFRLQLPWILMLCGVLRVFITAAGVTDKCARVPSLINSLSFGNGYDREQQQLVQFIVSSSAGFYISNVRVCMGMLFRFVYLWSVVLFAILGKSLSNV